MVVDLVWDGRGAAVGLRVLCGRICFVHSGLTADRIPSQRQVYGPLKTVGLWEALMIRPWIVVWTPKDKTGWVGYCPRGWTGIFHSISGYA